MGDFFSQPLPEPATKAMDGLLYGIFGHLEFGGCLGVRCARLARQKWLQSVKEHGFFLGHKLFPKPCEHLLENRNRPLA